MEKKKNRKKKNKQNKTAEDLSEGGASVTSAGENHVTLNGQGGTTKDTETAEVQDNPLSVVGGDQESHFPNESEIGVLKDINRQFQEERDKNLLKEASLLEQIKHLQNEKVHHIHKEANLEEQVLQLQKDNDTFMQKEVRLEEEIANLQQEKEVLREKEACLEEKVKQMEGEIKSWLQKENSNKEAIDFLNGDISRLQMQVAKLEQLKDNVLQENQLMAQTISGLQMQILNLERTAALSSSSESKTLTFENGDVTPELEAAHAQVGILIAENAELVEKVNALHAELRNNGVQKQENPADSSSGIMESATVAVNSDIPLVADVEVETPNNAPAANVSGTMMSASSEITEIEERDDQGATEHREIALNSLDTSEITEMDEIVQISLVADVEVETPNNAPAANVSGTRLSASSEITEIEERDDQGATEHREIALNSLDTSEITEMDEIVQISLDGNERQTTDNAVAVYNDEKTEIPISDAPLIGAPFRLISFMARYVSGADLVERVEVDS